jgi:hypothetical protein
MNKKEKIIEKLKELAKPICTYCLAIELGYNEQPDINSTLLMLEKNKEITRVKSSMKCCKCNKSLILNSNKK